MSILQEIGHGDGAVLKYVGAIDFARQGRTVDGLEERCEFIAASGAAVGKAREGGSLGCSGDTAASSTGFEEIVTTRRLERFNACAKFGVREVISVVDTGLSPGSCDAGVGHCGDRRALSVAKRVCRNVHVKTTEPAQRGASANSSGAVVVGGRW